MDELDRMTDKELLQRAWDELSALCGVNGRPKRWQMTIPVDYKRDSDIVFGEALRRWEYTLRNVPQEE